MGDIAQIIISLAAVTAAGTAIYGVREWKRQMKGKTDYEIARRYLKTALTLRNAIEYVRNPFISLTEMQESLEKEGFEGSDYKDNSKMNRAVYSVRWGKVRNAWTELEVVALEAEVSWGDNAKKASADLIQSVRELLGAVQTHLNATGGEKIDRLIYSRGTFGEPDEFSKKVSKSIDNLREYLKPHLL